VRFTGKGSHASVQASMPTQIVEEEPPKDGGSSVLSPPSDVQRDDQLIFHKYEDVDEYELQISKERFKDEGLLSRKRVEGGPSRGLKPSKDEEEPTLKEESFQRTPSNLKDAPGAPFAINDVQGYSKKIRIKRLVNKINKMEQQLKRLKKLKEHVEGGGTPDRKRKPGK
jgi:hypothetical protein